MDHVAEGVFVNNEWMHLRFYVGSVSVQSALEVTCLTCNLNRCLDAK